MHRLDRDTLFHLLLNAIRCSRLKRHRSGRPISASLESHEGQEELAKLLCDQLDNDSRMVIQTEWTGGYTRLGRWGVDEPDPAPGAAP